MDSQARIFDVYINSQARTLMFTCAIRPEPWCLHEQSGQELWCLHVQSGQDLDVYLDNQARIFDVYKDS